MVHYDELAVCCSNIRENMSSNSYLHAILSILEPDFSIIKMVILSDDERTPVDN